MYHNIWNWLVNVGLVNICFNNQTLSLQNCRVARFDKWPLIMIDKRRRDDTTVCLVWPWHDLSSPRTSVHIWQLAPQPYLATWPGPVDLGFLLPGVEKSKLLVGLLGLINFMLALLLSYFFFLLGFFGCFFVLVIFSLLPSSTFYIGYWIQLFFFSPNIEFVLVLIAIKHCST